VSEDYPFSDNFLTTISFSSQQRDGYQDVIPFPTDTELGQVPWVVDPQSAFPKAGTATADSKGGQNVQVVRGKALWKVSDKFNVTIAGDYTYQNQPSYPTTVLAVITPAGDALPNPFQALPGPAFGFMGANYNLCISTPAEILNDPAQFQATFGAHYRVQDWKELNRSLFSALKLEKIAMFLVLGIVILVASFSIVGNLIMVVVEKAREIALLKTLGTGGETFATLPVRPRERAPMIIDMSAVPHLADEELLWLWFLVPGSPQRESRKALSADVRERRGDGLVAEASSGRADLVDEAS